MEVFVLRHAITEDGESGLHQHKQSVLSLAGISQAKKIAASLPTIEKIFTSPDDRACQTGTVISSHLSRPVEVVSHDDLQEMRKPDSFIGKPYDDAEVIAMKNEMYRHISDPEFRLPGAENIFDVRKRVIRILDEIEHCAFERLLLITHSAFIRVMMLDVLSRKEGASFLPEMYPLLRKGLALSNASGLELFFGLVRDSHVSRRPEWQISYKNLPGDHLATWPVLDQDT